jgi:hypothetical protein
MYDPKFEKEVQRKMEELEFSPSEAVWTNIEQAVNREKKRRRIPFFWLFFLSGMLLMGAGVVYWASRPVAPAAPAIRADAGHPAKVKATDPAVVGGDDGSGEDKGRSGIGGRQEVMAEGGKRATGMQERPAAEGMRGAVAQHEHGAAGKEHATIADGEQGAIVVEGEQGVIKDKESDAVVQKAPYALMEREHYSYMPGLELLFRPAPRIAAAGLTGQTNQAIQKTVRATSLPKPKRPWEAAFTGGLGISSFKQSLLPASTVSAQNYYPAYALTAPLLVSANNGASTKNSPSGIQPDLSFSAGIMARKPLSARWAVTVGLDLEYYSSRLRTGQLVNGYTPVASSLLYAAAAAPIQTYPYYATGNDNVFTNRYYALEIPGSVQWQITHSRVMPLFWEAGFSLSYMVSSDALYYNPHSGVYFKDASVIDRTQFNLMTSLMVGLPLGGVRMQVGPQVEYGVTPLLKTSVSTGQHLFYGGIRFVIIPARGKK